MWKMHVTHLTYQRHGLATEENVKSWLLTLMASGRSMWLAVAALHWERVLDDILLAQEKIRIQTHITFTTLKSRNPKLNHHSVGPHLCITSALEYTQDYTCVGTPIRPL